MAARQTPPVPVADTALDGQGRTWHLTVASLDPYTSLWESPDRGGASATWAHLTLAYGPVVAVNSGRFAEVAA